MVLFSFLPVYSASSNLAYLYGDGGVTKYLIKHAMHLFLGFVIIYGVHKIPFHYFKGLSILMLPVVVILLLFTLAKGTTIGGANASRWIRIPFIGVSFQTSTLAAVVLMVYVARYLAKIKEKTITFKSTVLPLWLPVFAVLILILPANFSTTAIIFTMVLMLCFLGGYPIKYLVGILGVGAIALTLFVLTAKAFPDAFPDRVDTWVSRIESFFADDKDENFADQNYQTERAKTAIASGFPLGLGPGKSKQRNFIPQASSDFIYAIIVEETGLLGGLGLILGYLLLLFRMMVVSNKSQDIFGKLLVVGVGIPIIFQAFINMAVAVELFPVTGQTLPLISSGGTSIWMTCLALGIILSVSANRKVVKKTKGEENPLDVLSQTV
ncbi:MAG: FtsW/RodA/SpoVE family cell cycle protein [Flavobacteriaceae bacterium]|nr:FtsW/RodA/SpoVE family cell cycle protein [Flavobacteriaceae bacterium]